MGAFMRDSDAFTWYMERDPTLRSTVVTIAWLEESPDWDASVAKLERATRLVPSFRQPRRSNRRVGWRHLAGRSTKGSTSPGTSAG